MQYFVILNDGDTFTDLRGCKIVGVYELNEAALESVVEGNGKELVSLADEVIDLQEKISLLSVYDS